jgi:hypothetical protein
MIQISGKDMLAAIWDLEQVIKVVQQNQELTPAATLDGGLRIIISEMLERTLMQCEKLNFTDSKRRAAQLKAAVDYSARNVSEIFADLRGLFSAFIYELSAINFAMVRADKVQYFENDALFGQTVGKSFLSAKNNIKSAGNALAADLPDAAVYYLLSVIETGLRVLARNLKVKIPKTPLDYAGWKAVVNGIEKKLEAKTPKARGPKQAAALRFKHDLLADFKAFEVLRNGISHGRSHHNEQEAIGLFNRVREFMQRLALQVPE